MEKRPIFALRIHRMPAKVPDLSLLDGVVATEILQAMRASSAQLSRVGVRHALVGALAVGAWGYPRAGKDVGFLVGDEAFRHQEGGLVTMAPGVPVQAEGVSIDPLGATPQEKHLEDAVRNPVVLSGIPVAPLEALVYLKLKSPRRKDAADVVELLRVNDPAPIAAYLGRNAPALLEKFQALLSEAAE